MMNISLEVIPFIASILLELTSPYTTTKIEQLMKQKMNGIRIKQNQAGQIKDIFRYEIDLVQIISSSLLSMIAIIVLPIFRDTPQLIILAISLFVLVIFFSIRYFKRIDPFSHAVNNRGPYSWVSIFAICINFIIMGMVMVTPGQYSSTVQVEFLVIFLVLFTSVFLSIASATTQRESRKNRAQTNDNEIEIY